LFDAGVASSVPSAFNIVVAVNRIIVLTQPFSATPNILTNAVNFSQHTAASVCLAHCPVCVGAQRHTAVTSVVRIPLAVVRVIIGAGSLRGVQARQAVTPRRVHLSIPGALSIAHDVTLGSVTGATWVLHTLGSEKGSLVPHAPVQAKVVQHCRAVRKIGVECAHVEATPRVEEIPRAGNIVVTRGGVGVGAELAGALACCRIEDATGCANAGSICT
jgi:hypothetical protein